MDAAGKKKQYTAVVRLWHQTICGFFFLISVLPLGIWALLDVLFNCLYLSFLIYEMGVIKASSF